MNIPTLFPIIMYIYCYCTPHVASSSQLFPCRLIGLAKPPVFLNGTPPIGKLKMGSFG